jgi:hypothetical protein
MEDVLCSVATRQENICNLRTRTADRHVAKLCLADLWVHASKLHSCGIQPEPSEIAFPSAIVPPDLEIPF